MTNEEAATYMEAFIAAYAAQIGPLPPECVRAAPLAFRALRNHDALVGALGELYAALPDCAGDYIGGPHPGVAGRIHAPGIGASCVRVRLALTNARRAP